MRSLLKILGICLIILFVILLGLYTLDSAQKSNDKNWNNINLSYYEDTTCQLTVTEIDNTLTPDKFIKKDTNNFNFGRSHSAFWIKIFASDASKLKNYIAVYCPNVQNVQLYIPTKEGYKTYASGWGNNAIRNDEGMTYPVFYLNQERIVNQAIYLRIQSVYSHLYAIGLYNQAELQHAKLIDYFLNSFLFGILLTIVIINLIIYFILKNNICLIFALCVFLISVHQGCTTGIYNVLLPKHSSIIMSISIEIGLLYLISIIIFFMVISELKIYNTVYYLYCKALIMACVLCYPICFIDKLTANLYAHLLSVVPAIFIFYASIRLYFEGKKRFNLFLIGWNITMITYIIVTLCTEGFLRLQNNYISIHGTLIGIVIASIIFTIATVNYTKIIQMEHIKMQHKVQLASDRIKETETALMQTQIKPNFLYNTLTAIEQMCEIDSQKAQTAIVDFANYLRSNIDFSTETRLIMIEKELSNVKHYLALEQMRFEKRLHVIYDIQSGKFMVPPLIIQPIVENAVRHGVTKKAEGGTIKILVRETDSSYIIAVTDNGIGFNPDSDTWSNGHHIGIDNARKRLSQQCRGTLNVESKIGIGTNVTIIIPRGEVYELNCS